MSITLKAARVNAGLTQKQVAKILGKSEETIRNYERGKTFPDVDTIQKIEEIYKISYNDIIFTKK